MNDDNYEIYEYEPEPEPEANTLGALDHEAGDARAVELYMLEFGLLDEPLTLRQVAGVNHMIGATDA